MSTFIQQPIRIHTNGILLEGILAIPGNAIGMVLFSHGSGSSHRSPRNQYVAEVLYQAGVATLLFDLLTTEEDQVYANRFNIPLLSERLLNATCWVMGHSSLCHLPIAYFGASTGAASGLIASVKYLQDGCRGQIKQPLVGVVCRGGRTDLAAEWLSAVKTPVLCIVGEQDTEVIALNNWALQKIPAEKKLVVLPGASHLFEEPGTLEQMAGIACEWLVHQFVQVPAISSNTAE